MPKPLASASPEFSPTQARALLRPLEQLLVHLKQRQEAFLKLDTQLQALQRQWPNGNHQTRAWKSQLRNAGYFTQRAQALGLLEQLSQKLYLLKRELRALGGRAPLECSAKAAPKPYLHQKPSRRFLGKVTIAQGGFL